MQLLTNQLQEDYELIHPLNRAQLIDDIFAFADKHILSYEKAFNIISYLHRETEYVPLRVAFRALSILDARLQISVLYQQYRVSTLQIIIRYGLMSIYYQLLKQRH